MTIEREIKLIADVDVALPDLEDVLPGISVGQICKLQLAAVYYDTPTLSLARSGVTLRARTGESGSVWTLKLPTIDSETGLSRHEHTFDEPLGPVPQSARLATRAYVRSQTLGPVVRLHTERTQIPVALDGNPLLTLCDDTVVADGGTEPVRSFREIELELAVGDVATKAVKRLVDALRGAGCRDEPPVAKAIRALGERALEPPDVAEVDVGKRSSAGALVRSAIARSVAQLVDHHAGVWFGRDPEDVHRFRVATRRLRSDLLTFAPLLDQHWMSWTRDELRWLGTEVGRARDADVLTERLRSQMSVA